jgi:hypothetical protein
LDSIALEGALMTGFSAPVHIQMERGEDAKSGYENTGDLQQIQGT